MTAFEQIMKFIDIQVDEKLNKKHGYLGQIKMTHIFMRRDFFMKILSESKLHLELMETDYKGRTHKFMGVPVDVRHELETTMPFNVLLVRD